MDIYKKAGMFIEEFTVSNPSDASEADEDLTNQYKDFQSEFAPEKLATIPIDAVSNFFVQLQDRISRLDQSYTDKVMVDNKLRDAILAGSKIILNAKLVTIEDYDTMHDKLVQVMGNVALSPFVYKYFSVIYYDKISICYHLEIQTHLLYCCSILPHEKLYVRGGQLTMLSNHAFMLSATFNKVALDYFGSIKRYCRLDITNDQFDVLPTYKEQQIVSIGFKELGDLNSYVQQGQININMLRDNLAKIYFANNPAQAEVKAKEIFNFWSANVDTVFVVMRKGNVIALAECQGGYHFGNDHYFAHIKKVNWKRFLEENSHLPMNDEGKNTTICNILDKFNTLYLYQKYYDIFHAAAASSSLSRIHPFNQILFGASGTGKTFCTTEMAMAIIENREVDLYAVRSEKDQAIYRQKYDGYVEKFQISFITFHSGYTYSDFIQGLRPDSSLENGVFKRMADRANRSRDRNFVMIIDEINRANISSVFGEVISLIDQDKRSGEANEVEATLPLGGGFVVPNNLYIIATLNSTDKSLPAIDPALRRRFDFIEMLPNENLIQDPVLKSVFLNLNDTILKIFQNTDFLIGHSYFMNKKDKDLVNIINLNIIPLLYEYFQNEPDKIKQILEFSVGNYVSVLDSRFGKMRVELKQQAQAAGQQQAQAAGQQQAQAAGQQQAQAAGQQQAQAAGQQQAQAAGQQQAQAAGQQQAQAAGQQQAQATE